MSNTTQPIFSDGAYNKLKYFTQIVLPAVGAFYVGLASLWGLPNPEAVAGTILAVVTLLGTVLGLSTAQYNRSDAKYDGVMNIGADTNGLVLNDDVETLEGKKDLLFKVNPVTPTELEIQYDPEHKA